MVTGSASGIGKAIALAFAEAGIAALVRTGGEELELIRTVNFTS